MPFPRPTLTALRTQAMQDITASDLPNADGFLRRAVLRVLAWVQAGLAYLHYGYLDWISLQSTPFTSTGEYLEGWAALAPTPVLREAPTFASGPAAWPGVVNTALPAGTVCSRGDGVQYATAADATVGGGGSVAVTVVAAGGGLERQHRQRHAAGRSRPRFGGINSTGAATAAITGGADLETDGPLRDPHAGELRGTAAWRQPGGFRDLGVAGDRRHPRMVRTVDAGAGTVTVYFMMDVAEAAYGGFPQGTQRRRRA